jgi:ADP-ribose pyrophosphatase YjhB (NUDIX family)
MIMAWVRLDREPWYRPRHHPDAHAGHAEQPRAGCGAAIVVDGRILLLRRLTDPEAGSWPRRRQDRSVRDGRGCDAPRGEREVGIVVGAVALLCFVDQIDVAAGTHWVAPIYRVLSFTGTPRTGAGQARRAGLVSAGCVAAEPHHADAGGGRRAGPIS